MTDPTEKELTAKLLHDLAHQAMEVKGVRVLSDECIPLLTIVLMIVMKCELTHPQILGTLMALPELLSETMCEQCKDMAGRISKHMIEDYAGFVRKHREAMKGKQN